MLYVAGFENTEKIAQGLKNMVNQFGEDTLSDTGRFISLMNDFIPEYEKERRLLKNVLSGGVLGAMRKEANQQMGITRARDLMANEMFLSDAAIEFVLVCFTYLLGWNYQSPLSQPAQPAQPAAAAPRSPMQQGMPQQPPMQGMQGMRGMQGMQGMQPPVQGLQQPMPQPSVQQGMNRTPAQPAQPAQPAPAPAQPAAPMESEQRIYHIADAARSRLKGNVRVPDGYTMLESFCFDGFGFMRSVELPRSLCIIGEYAFSDCKRLKAVSLPDKLRVIRRGAFNACGKLTVLRIPQGVTEIEESTCSFCHSLEIVEIPTTVTSIGNQAFAGCTSLRRLFIPESVTSIAEDAFQMCDPGLVIRCYENSYAHTYAKRIGLRIETVSKGAIFG